MEKSFTEEAMESPHENTETESIEEEQIPMDLKEFGVDSDAPDLFSSETENFEPLRIYYLLMRKIRRG